MRILAKTMKNRILRKCLQKTLSGKIKISPISIYYIRRDDLRLWAYKRYTNRHLLTEALKQKHKEKSKSLRRWYAKNAHMNFIYWWKNSYCRRNVQQTERKSVCSGITTYVCTSEIVPRVWRGHHPASVSVWWGCDGDIEFHFCEIEVGITEKVYSFDVLEKVVKTFNKTLFANKPQTFKQLYAPCHKAKTI